MKLFRLSDEEIDRIADAILTRLEKKDFVLTNSNEAAKDLLKSRLLRKKWLKLEDIQKGELWGSISREQIFRIAKKHAGIMEMRKNENREKPFWEVSIEAVKRIGYIRHTL